MPPMTVGLAVDAGVAVSWPLGEHSPGRITPAREARTEAGKVGMGESPLLVPWCRFNSTETPLPLGILNATKHVVF